MVLGPKYNTAPITPHPNYQKSLREEMEELKEVIREGQQTAETEQKKKPFDFPSKWKRTMNKSVKLPNRLLVFYLNKFGKIEPPKLLPVLEGDMVVIHEKPYEVNPKAVWRMGKYNVYMIREIDRRPVSNEDYDEVKRRGDCTDSDVFLIKMAMRAVQKGARKEMSKAVLIIIGVVVVGGLIFFFSRS